MNNDWSTWVDIALGVSAVVATGLGVLVLAVAAIGLVRLPDVLCRAHALAMGAALGLGLILVGFALHLRESDALFKATLAIAFQFATIPVSSHLFSRMAKRTGLPLWQTTEARLGEATVRHCPTETPPTS